MREVLKASDGMVLTDGTTYGIEIFLAEGMDKDSFHEISREEYDKILEKEAKENLYV